MGFASPRWTADPGYRSDVAARDARRMLDGLQIPGMQKTLEHCSIGDSDSEEKLLHSGPRLQEGLAGCAHARRVKMAR